MAYAASPRSFPSVTRRTWGPRGGRHGRQSRGADASSPLLTELGRSVRGTSSTVRVGSPLASPVKHASQGVRNPPAASRPRTGAQYRAARGCGESPPSQIRPSSSRPTWGREGGSFAAGGRLAGHPRTYQGNTRGDRDSSPSASTEFSHGAWAPPFVPLLSASAIPCRRGRVTDTMAREFRPLPVRR
jgi:hypothetical protein